MTGKEIYKIISKKHKDYINSDKEEKQPSISLTTHQCYKLADLLGFRGKYYNSLLCLASGDLSKVCYESVVITIKTLEETK